MEVAQETYTATITKCARNQVGSVRVHMPLACLDLQLVHDVSEEGLFYCNIYQMRILSCTQKKKKDFELLPANKADQLCQSWHSCSNFMKPRQSTT